MNVHVLQHVPFEGLGSIYEWLAARSADVTFTHFYEHSTLPAVADIDLVIALGGPMSVNDEASFPWFREEKRFIAAAVRSGKAVLGLCLGAQLIANALGADVYPGPVKEIGWHEIEAESNQPEQFHFPRAVTVFHWHGETFDLPPGAIRLARSVGCQNQAFQIGNKVIGLQFHLETTPEVVESMIINCGDQLVSGRFIQSASAIRGISATTYNEINRLMADVLDFITSKHGN